MNKCCRCKIVKPDDEFWKSKSTKTGLQKRCKDCQQIYYRANREKILARKKVHYAANIENRRAYGRSYRIPNLAKIKASQRKTRYGLTDGDYQKMLSDQAGACRICGFIFSWGRGRELAPSVDHCHKTGIVRGLLCWQCNLMLGNAKDNQTTLLRAAGYLKEFER